MTADEEYLDNLLKAFEEEENEREQNAPQEKQIITDSEDVDEELLASLLGSLDDDNMQGEFLSTSEKSEGEDGAFTAEDEDWKLNLDELLANVGSDENIIENTSELESLLAAAANEAIDLGQDLDIEPEPEKKESSFMSYDIDVTQYIDGLDDADSSLMELNDLLKKADGNEILDTLTEVPDGLPEDLLKSFQNEEMVAEEVVPPQKAEKKSKHLWKKGQKEKKDTGLLDNMWQRLVFEEEPEEVPVENEENAEAEIREEKEKKDKKKDKKNKKKKKGDAGENAEPDMNADIDELEESEKDKKKKKKREKKEKKKKDNLDDIVGLPKQKPKKVLTKSALMALIAFGATLIAAIVCLSIFLPDFTDKRKAREAFYDGNYEEAYVLLYGKHLNESDALLLNRVESVLEIERYIESYYLYDEIGEKAKALDALFEGIRHCMELPDINEYGSGPEIMIAYNRILDILRQQYGMEEVEALEIITYDDVRYSIKIYEMAEGMVFGASEKAETQEEMLEEGPQDILPEEEDIITLEAENEGA